MQGRFGASGACSREVPAGDVCSISVQVRDGSFQETETPKAYQTKIRVIGGKAIAVGVRHICLTHFCRGYRIGTAWGVVWRKG